MSDEYWLRTKSRAELLSLLEPVFLRLGLVRDSISKTQLSMSFPDADPSVKAWGGNVSLTMMEGAWLLTLNGVAPSSFVETLREGLLAHDIACDVEEA